MDNPAIERPEEAVYRYVRAYIEEHGFAPSLREISAACYIGRSTALHYLDRLEMRGRLVREPGRARGIRLLSKKD